MNPLIFFIFYLLKSVAAAPLPPTLECGRSTTAELRILGGGEARPNSWPWIVSISTMDPEQNRNSNRGASGDAISSTNEIRMNRKPHNCGGVLINREWVLTAAHCLDKHNQSNVFPSQPSPHWRVTAGIHSREMNTSESRMWQTRGVRAFIRHGQFRDLSFAAYNDVALLLLDSPITFNSHVRPICLPQRRVPGPGWNRCYAAGWGTTAEEGEYYSLTLREVQMPIVSSEACQNRYGQLYNSQQHLCGGDWYNGSKDSCKGDSGGPLACQLDNGSWYVAGIVSWGMGCGRKFTPGVYTNVRHYEDWIVSRVVPYSQENWTLFQRGIIRA